MSDISDLDRHRYLSLATFRRNGAEVTTPVWFAAGDGKLYVFTAGAVTAGGGEIEVAGGGSRASA